MFTIQCIFVKKHLPCIKTLTPPAPRDMFALADTADTELLESGAAVLAGIERLTASKNTSVSAQDMLSVATEGGGLQDILGGVLVRLSYLRLRRILDAPAAARQPPEKQRITVWE